MNESAQPRSLFIVFMRFSTHRARASEFMAEHNAWVARGLEHGVFVVVGSLQPARGGALLVRGLGRAELESRIAEDPFVANEVVEAEVIELTPVKVDPRLAFLIEAAGSGLGAQ